MGAYSPGMRVNLGNCEMIFVAGQIAQDADGNVISDDIVEQTEYVFNCIQKILNAGNSSLDDVVKAQFF